MVLSFQTSPILSTSPSPPPPSSSLFHPLPPLLPFFSLPFHARYGSPDLESESRSPFHDSNKGSSKSKRGSVSSRLPVKTDETSPKHGGRVGSAGFTVCMD
ncbi:hypothetical protein IE53DRAFT_390797 [Violaceomyces palustris]|uniref:Uncharacterized protein n=1 Tax=Violaceomyces palustris TaxID=1673888 RepID=A0ACD0NMP5_9BASI|nr:hypothetical protein IE53DRAFT_390797 [Violaceomyces palustris]